MTFPLNFVTGVTDKFKKGLNLSQKSFVLRALKILGLEEILKLSELLKKNEEPLKQVVSPETSQDSGPHEDAHETLGKGAADVLVFPSKDQSHYSGPLAETELSESQLSDESELFLLKLEYSKLHEGTVQRLDALREYQKTSQTYQIQKKTGDGKSVRKIISTNGILINKKQA
jgi:hypothetical protein